MTRSPALTWLLASTLSVPFAVAIVGCNDDGATEAEIGNADTSDSNPGDGDGDGDSGDGDGDSGDGDSGDGDGDSGDGDGDTGDGDGDGDGDTGDGDGDGDPEPVDTSIYTAEIMPGGLDRITIMRLNNKEPNCTRMVIYSPVMSDMYDIAMPDLWRIEMIDNWQQGWCPNELVNPTNFPDAGTGSITVGGYDALGNYPCVLNFDIELEMASNPDMSTIWKKTGVPVTGVNCG